MSSTMSFFDTIILILLFLSSFFAMLRGFTKETLSILSWLLAITASFVSYANTSTREYASGLIQPEWLAYSLLVGITFILTLIISAFIAGKISKLILKSNIGILDRIFGILFGFFRGYIVVMILFAMLTWLFDENEPKWLTNSMFYSHLNNSLQKANSILPDNPSQIIENIEFEKIENVINFNNQELPNIEVPGNN